MFAAPLSTSQPYATCSQLSSTHSLSLLDSPWLFPSSSFSPPPHLIRVYFALFLPPPSLTRLLTVSPPVSLQSYQWLKEKIVSEDGRKQQAKLKELNHIAEKLGCTLPQLAVGKMSLPTFTFSQWAGTFWMQDVTAHHPSHNVCVQFWFDFSHWLHTDTQTHRHLHLFVHARASIQ